MNQSLLIAESHYRSLMRHLFPGDHDEHGAVVIAGIVETPRGVRFLTREVVLARDGIDYVPGTRGYRALTTDFIMQVSDRCVRENLCYFAVHCHGGKGSVGFSPDDLASQKRGYPALVDITNGGPVGALVFAVDAAAGNVWRQSGITQLDEVTIIGPNIRHLYPTPQKPVGVVSDIYDRQSMLFGTTGQLALSRSKIAIIGMGGVGSLVSQWMAHLGVGHIIGVDFDYLEPTNRPRVVGATAWDAGEPFSLSANRLMKAIGTWLAKRKVHIAKRVARNANRAVFYESIVGNVIDQSVADRLKDVDYLFLCADGMQPRLVFNALVHQYLIPGVQIGSKVPVDKKTGAVLDVFVTARRVLPNACGGCLSCNKLIPPNKLQEESITVQERRQQQYVEDNLVHAPSVITLNALAAAQAVNDFLFSFHGLLKDEANQGYLLHYPKERSWSGVEVSCEDDCLHCSISIKSAYGRGDRWSLPCKKAAR